MCVCVCVCVCVSIGGVERNSQWDQKFKAPVLARNIKNNDPVCKTGKKTQMCIMDFWTQRERERVG